MSDESDRQRAIAELGKEEYERQNAEAKRALHALCTAALGLETGAVANAALILYCACAQADGGDALVAVQALGSAWRSKLVADLRSAIGDPGAAGDA